MGFFPGGPSPDSVPPSHTSKPIDTRHQAAASAIDTETHHHHQGSEMAPQQELAANGPQPITRELPQNLPPQPSGRLASGTDTSPRHPFSDEHAEIALNVRVAATNTEAAAEGSPSLDKEERRSTSVASRRTDRSLPANDTGKGASAAGAVAAANGPPDADSNRAASVDIGVRQKATIGKEERTLKKIISYHLIHL